MKFSVVLCFLTSLVASAVADLEDNDTNNDVRHPFVHTVAHHLGQLGPTQCLVDADCRNKCRNTELHTEMANCYEGRCFCMLPDK